MPLIPANEDDNSCSVPRFASPITVDCFGSCPASNISPAVDILSKSPAYSARRSASENRLKSTIRTSTS